MTENTPRHNQIPSETSSKPLYGTASRARAREFHASLSPDERDQPAAANAWLALNSGRGERLQDLIGTAPALDDDSLAHTAWHPFIGPASETLTTNGSAS